MADGMKIVSDKWMLQSRQIVNWGSYGGWHEFRPSMDETMPVTLLAGASESGKSTLVDAQISLLYPSGTPLQQGVELRTFGTQRLHLPAWHDRRKR